MDSENIGEELSSAINGKELFFKDFSIERAST
jgi:hypothetical protein